MYNKSTLTPLVTLPEGIVIHNIIYQFPGLFNILRYYPAILYTSDGGKFTSPLGNSQVWTTHEPIEAFQWSNEGDICNLLPGSIIFSFQVEMFSTNVQNIAMERNHLLIQVTNNKSCILNMSLDEWLLAKFGQLNHHQFISTTEELYPLYSLEGS
jgi:hypothetical protein